MKSKIAWAWDPVSFQLLGPVIAYRNPVNPAEYLLPADSTFVEPAEVEQPQRWDGKKWVLA